MKFILINPPSPFLDNDAAYPPSGLLYVAAALEKCGQEAEIIDLTGGINWRDRISRAEGDVYGITCVTPNVNTVREISRFLPPGKPVIIGGVHPTFLPDDARKNIRCDAVVRGEAETVIPRLAADCGKGELQKVYEGGITPAAEIPRPARHLVDLHRYNPGGEPAVPVYTSRGCPFNCSFCSKISGQTYRVLPIPRVVEEIREVRELGFRQIVFGDDDIAIQPDRLQELLRAIRPLGISFRLNQDARAVRKDLLALAAESGCLEISFGIESGSERMLGRMNKKNTVSAGREAILATREQGLIAKAYFLVNFPGEDEESVAETLKFARETRPDKWLLSAFAPLPGSDTFSHPEKYGINWMSGNWEDFYLVGKAGGFRPCFTTPDLSFEKQVLLHDRLYQGLKEILG